MMELNDKQVLVTGGTGFVGSHLAERLVREGARVRVLGNYRSQPSIGNLAFVDPDLRQNIDVVWGDICDRDSVQQSIEGCSIVFHLAALIGIPYSYIAPESYVRTNITGTLNVLQAARACHIEKLIHTSTSEVYGSAQYTPIDESHPLVGQSPYSATKIGADKLVESYHRSFELPAVTIRPFNIYGPRQSQRAIIPTVAAQCAAGMDTIRIGDPTPRRDLTFVTDTVDGYIRAAQTAHVLGRSINIGTGKSIDMGSLAAKICTLTGGAKVETDSHRIRPANSEVRELLCDNTQAQNVLGWAPKVSLEDGLGRTVEFIRQHPEMFTPQRYAV